MDWLVIVLRIVHIFSGIFWVGSAYFFFRFIEPTANALGPDSQKFMHYMVANRRVVPAILAASTLNVAAGVALYWRDSQGLNLGWITSPTGLAFTLGGAVAIVAWLTGMFGIGPSVHRLDEAAAAMAGAGRPPSGDELTRFQALQARLHRLGLLDVIMLSFVVLTMATARYISAF